MVSLSNVITTTVTYLHCIGSFRPFFPVSPVARLGMFGSELIFKPSTVQPLTEALLTSALMCPPMLWNFSVLSSSSFPESLLPAGRCFSREKRLPDALSEVKEVCDAFCVLFGGSKALPRHRPSPQPPSLHALFLGRCLCLASLELGYTMTPMEVDRIYAKQPSVL